MTQAPGPFPPPSGSSRFPAGAGFAHPSDSRRLPHPSGSSRFPGPAGFAHPSDSRRLPHPSDSQRQPHASDSGRLPPNASVLSGPLGSSFLRQLPFQILGVLGQGGMGRVFHAIDRQGRQVALKVLLQPGNARRVQRLLREGTLAADLQHPHVARLYEVGLVGEQPYLSYELVEDARPLDRVLPELGLEARVQLLIAVADGVAHAHARGITHRDLKPENVLVDRAQHPRVMDFGLSISADVERLTLSGAMLGTPQWMAPEQISSQREAQGPPTDVWALGVMLYQALTDEAPFSGDDLPSLFVAITRGKPLPPRRLNADVGPALQDVCLRALQTDPARRFPHAGSFHDALLAALRDPTLRRAPPRWRAPLGIAAGLLLGFGGMAAILRLTGPDPQPTTAGPTGPEVAAAAAPGLAEVEALLDAQDPRGPERLDSYLIAHPDDPDAWRLQGEVLTERRGDLAAGVQAFKKSLELGPTLKAYVGLGVSLTKLGRMTEAQEPLDQAVRLDPQSGYALTAQAFLLHEQGMFEGALAAIERAIDLEPERAGSHDLKGRVLQALGDVPGAEAAYRRSLALEPSAPTYTNLAAVLCKAERFDEARRATAQAVELEPQSPRTHDAAGMVEYYAGRFEQAIVHFDDALALDPAEVPTLINRGYTHKRLGHAARARADFEAVLAYAPEGDPARDTARKGLQGLGVAAAR